jgi:hypothetical protein
VIWLARAGLGLPIVAFSLAIAIASSSLGDWLPV